MTGDAAAPGDRILDLWRTLDRWPGGARLFDFLLARMVPYSGTVRPRVRALEPGRCRARMRERRAVRNHLDSVHATALATLGELVTGLATLTALPAGVRGIVTALEAEYEKKARGVLTAECRTEPSELPRPGGSVEHAVEGGIRDEGGDRVATVRATWRLSAPETAS